MGGTGTYSTEKTGDDIIVTVGDGKITLSGAANLSTLNIAGSEVAKPTWTLSGTIATYGTLTNTLFTVTGVKSTDGLSLNGSTVTVAASALNKSNVTISSGYKLALANGIASPSTTAATWTLNETTATYKAQSTSAGYTLNNNQIVYTSASGGGTLATIKGVTSTEGLTLKNGVITLKPTALSKNVSISGGYKYNLAAGDYGKGKITATKNADTITSNGKNLLINMGAGNDSVKVNGANTSVNGGAGKLASSC